MAIANTHPEVEHGPVLEATEARQGRRGLHALWILIISTALAAIVLAILLAIQAPGLSGPGGQVRANDASVSTPLTQARQTENDQR